MDTSPSIPARVGFILGPVLALIVGIWLNLGTDLPIAAVVTAVVTVLTATWWICEPIPIPFTSLVPLAILPIAGVLDHGQIGDAVGNRVVILIMAGFMLAKGIEQAGLHRRIAIGILRLIGDRGPRITVLGFMLASALLSMWISNTATVLILLPVALAIIDRDESRTLTIPLLLGTAWAASIGGMASPIGSPPNAICIATLDRVIGDEANATFVSQHDLAPLGFARWMAITAPVVLVMLPLAWLFLCRRLRSKVSLELPPAGAWTSAERRVLVIFLVTIAGWIFRNAPFGGWSDWLGLDGAWDSHVALLGVILLAITPDGQGKRLLSWDEAIKIPWGLLLLFAAGISIGLAFDSSGLSKAIGESLSDLSDVPVYLVILILCLLITFLTEITSNTATANLILPIMVPLALVLDVDPLLLMLPVTLSCSCAFMLPVATPPNAIIYGSNMIPLRTMAHEGVVLNVIGAIVISLTMYLLL